MTTKQRSSTGDRPPELDRREQPTATLDARFDTSDAKPPVFRCTASGCAAVICDALPPEWGRDPIKCPQHLISDRPVPGYLL